MIRFRPVPGLLLLSAAVFFSLHGQETSVSPVETISAESIRHHVYFLASDSLEGRFLGSQGCQIAAQYGESQFRSAGLKPIIRQGDESSYLQPVPVARRTPQAEPELTIRTPRGETKFLHGRDFRWLDGEILSCENKPLPVVFVGYGIHEPAAGWDDFKGLDVRNKVLVMRHGVPLKNGRPVLPAPLHEKYADESSWQAKVAAMMMMPAAAILVPANESLLKSWDDIPMQTGAPQTVLNDRSADAWSIASLFVVKPEIIGALLAGQRQAAPRPEAKDVTFLLAASFEDEDVPAWNVVGLVEGTDPVLKNEYIAVTAHLDHLPPRNGEIMNGADDNASGCAGVMEIAEAVAQRPFKRSVVFVLFTGEELYMALGSRYFLGACPVPRDQIIADINLDMIGRTDEANVSDRAHYALDTDNVQPKFKKLIREVNDRTIRWPLKYEIQPDNASDNLIFELMRRIPGVFFYSGHHPDRHQPTDDPDKIDYDKAEKISRLGYEITKELATQPIL